MNMPNFRRLGNTKLREECFYQSGLFSWFHLHDPPAQVHTELHNILLDRFLDQEDLSNNILTAAFGSIHVY